MTDVIVVGAGAAGLSAARILSRAKKSVAIIEARDRIGGRIHTIRGEFSFPVEAGAEFMHGDLPFTKALMNESKVSYFSGEGRTWNVQGNKLSEGDLFHEDWDVLLEKLQSLDHDMTIGKFLELYFGESKYSSLADSVRRFVEGYDAANINKASAFALREEWSSENIKGYRPRGGYSQLMEFLRSEIEEYKGQILLSSAVKKIIWKKGHVEIITGKNERFKAGKVLITIPVSLLKGGMIEFDPPLAEHRKAIQDMEVGGVIKFLAEFRDPIWERRGSSPFRKMPGLNFLFSDAVVPTWWTQQPDNVPLLTGWLAGPVLKTFTNDNAELTDLAFHSLGYLFGTTKQALKKEVKVLKVINWYGDPYSEGAYAYSTLKTSKAVRILSRPIDDTIYFAGEALYDGAEMGTVEAALATGNLVAESINLVNVYK